MAQSASKTGSYGIPEVTYSAGAVYCLTCYRSWMEDITPSGRCPWEYDHETDKPEDRLRRRQAITDAQLRGD